MFYNRQQKVLIQPYFHLSQVCFGGLFNALPLGPNASFGPALDHFILNAWQAGLWSYWEEIGFRYAKRAGYARVFLDTYPVEPLNLEFFNTAWIVLALGIPISSFGWNMQYVLNMLSPFARMAVFQEIVWFISPLQRLDQVDEFVRRIDEAFGSTATQTVVNNNTDMRMMHSSARRNHISFVFTTGADDPIMKVFSKVLLGRHFYFSMIMYVDKVGDMQPIHELLLFAYNEQFTNSIVYFESEGGINQLFGVSKFPSMAFENRTDFLSFMGKVWKKVLNARSDVEGFGFSTPLRQDLPHLFSREEATMGVPTGSSIPL
ncbi:hypothetical protein M5D96_008478 [Drosophila gunungcola]|uniref:Uncharacterized protein n=1 Tax=Drosophila gunungcola TaxID=103775 RepID=A0A9Q0BNP8_9MUSC|nr:hypothetical protein M5D96_008478 [Drosophila gunungcola]